MNKRIEKEIENLDKEINQSFLYRSRMWKRKIYFCQTSMQRLSRFLREKNENIENPGLDFLIKEEIKILSPRLKNIEYSIRQPKAPYFCRGLLETATLFSTSSCFLQCQSVTVELFHNILNFLFLSTDVLLICIEFFSNLILCISFA